MGYHFVCVVVVVVDVGRERGGGGGGWGVQEGERARCTTRERENRGGADGVGGQKATVEMLELFTKREHEDGWRRMGEDGMYDVIVEEVQSVCSM